MTLAEKMAEFVFRLEMSDVPAAVERAARRHLADTLACAIGALRQPPVLSLVDYARARPSSGRASIIGHPDHTSPAMAALVNGTMVRYLDANDISSFGGGHFSDGIPPLLALAQDRALSAADLVRAVVALYELQGALALAFDFMPRGYHALTQIPWTAPIVAAHLMGADAEASVSAAGLSGSTGMIVNTWLKPAHFIPSIKAAAVGLAGQRAVESAELAARGITAPADALEFAIETLSRMGAPAADLTAFDKLGSRWTTHRNVIKSYPSQIYTQAAVQAALWLSAKIGSAREVDAITLYGHRNVCAGVQGSAPAFRPQSREAADHSTPFVMAAALISRRLTPQEFEGDAWLRPDVRAVMDRISLIVDPDMDRAFTQDRIFGVRLEASLSDGSARAVEIHQPKGHPDDPLLDEELTAKIARLTDGIAPAHLPPRLLDHCMNMTSEQDLEKLIELCAPP